MKAFIKDIAVCYPSKILSNDDLVKRGCKWTAKQIHSKIGVKSRHICSEDESSLTLGLEATRKLLTKNPEMADRIDYILFSTLCHDHFMLNSAAYIQKALNLPENIASVDFKLGCSGYITLLTFAKALIESGIACNVLVITADTYSKVLDEYDFGTMTVFGDAATATLISTDGKYRIAKCSSGTDGTGSQIHAGRIGLYGIPDNEDPYGANQKDSRNFYMIGEEIFDFVNSKISEFIKPFIGTEDFGIDDGTIYLFHQANQYMLNYLRKKLMIPKDKFYMNMESTGNTSTSSIPIALNDILNSSIPSKIICCGFGGGYCWNGMILKNKHE